jgi:uncharacterized membrane protein YraQ (UPF0718 family)
MGFAMLLAVLPVAAGAALGLVRAGGRIIGPIRTFALVSAMAVVLGQLLPDALEDVGLAALGAFALGFVLPSLVEKLEPYVRREPMPYGHSMLGLQIGYFGLLWHQLGDGLAMGAFSGPAHAGHSHLDLLIAIAAHKVPVTSFVVLAFAAHGGAGIAVRRAVGLAVATAIGVGVAGLVDAAVVERWEPWVAAIVGGLLLHVVAHDWHPEHRHGDRPEGAPGEPEPAAQTSASKASAVARALEVLALAAGLSIFLLESPHGHGDPGGVHIRTLTAVALLELTLETAPVLLFGLMVGAALQVLGSRIPMGWLRSGSDLRQAIRGAVIGAPLPICACGVLPVAQSLRMRGGRAALVVAFLLATPELGVETFALTVRFLGWELAWVRLFAAVVVAIVAALLVARAVRPAPRDRADEAEAGLSHVTPDAGDAGAFRRMLAHFEELLHHVGPWTLVGLIAAAYTQAALPEDSLGHFSAFGLDILVVSLVAMPSYVCASSATPLAAVLLAKGLSPGAVLAGLLLGPATNLATVGFLRQHFGGRAAALGLGGLVVATWLVSAGLNLSPFPGDTPLVTGPGVHAHGWIAWAALFLLGAFVLRAVWKDGVRSWLGALGESLGVGGHDHGHAERHGHGHGHGH